ncbi:hypothetical protein B0H11DRAFT_1991014 [Mycena galericulata]|nr:hypothetical protein B0H11DRAFT_1991014 [Mycena galericulata]
MFPYSQAVRTKLRCQGRRGSCSSLLFCHRTCLPGRSTGDALLLRIHNPEQLHFFPNTHPRFFKASSGTILPYTCLTPTRWPRPPHTRNITRRPTRLDLCNLFVDALVLAFLGDRQATPYLLLRRAATFPSQHPFPPCASIAMGGLNVRQTLALIRICGTVG